jgi:hypothetical protein
LSPNSPSLYAPEDFNAPKSLYSPKVVIHPSLPFAQVFNVREISGTVRGMGKDTSMPRGFAIAFRLTVAALALGLSLGLGVDAGFAQQIPALPQCTQFGPLQTETQKRGDAVSAAMKAHADRKQICALMTAFVGAEGALVKFLEDNKTWCGVPDQAVTVSKANHEKSVKFRTAACTDNGPHPKAPSLSDAIKTPTVDSATNTKTGRGTFDTLTGNPLAK